MKRIQTLLAPLILAAVFAAPLHSGEPEAVFAEDYSPAYKETTGTAHWSAYLPIAATVAAAAWFGIADGNHSGETSHASGSSSSSNSSSSTSGSSFSFGGSSNTSVSTSSGISH